MAPEQIQIAAFYKFLNLTQEDLPSVRQALEAAAADFSIGGLVVLGTEGINATVAGTLSGIAEFKTRVVELLGGSEIEFKDSFAHKIPFARFKVDVRPEIITTKDLTLSSTESAGTHLSPAEWHAMIENDPDVVIVDTRNDYETRVGIFENAIDPKIKKFSDFQSFAESGALPRDKKLLMYCTGGIRCEKAVPEVKRLGYEHVYQLEGGILRYLEAFPNGHFKGECFVFDHRVAVDQNLQPSNRYRLCPHCGNPGENRISCMECGKETVVCAECMTAAHRMSCSKNCAYHIKRKGNCSAQPVGSSTQAD